MSLSPATWRMVRVGAVVAIIWIVITGLSTSWTLERMGPVLLGFAGGALAVLLLTELGARNRAKDEAAATRASGTTPDQP